MNARRHSREVRNAVCDAPGCASVGVIYKCGRCAARFYCSIDCQRTDWATHPCTEPNQAVAPVDELVGWLRTNVRIRRRSHDPHATTALEQSGYLGSGSDAHVIGTVVDGHALALKLGLFDPALASSASLMDEAYIHHSLFRHTHAMQVSGPRRSAAVVALHTYWQARVTVSDLIMAMHPGRPVPCHDEQRLVHLLASEQHVDVRAPHLVVGMCLELMPMSVTDLWRARATTDAQFNNVYAQLVACLGVMQPAGLTHTDLSATNARLIGCSARRIVFRLGARYYELPLLSSIHPGAGINGTRAVVADFGRATTTTPRISLSHRLAWGDVPDAALHWPNEANPGYDLWMMAVDAVLNSLPGCLPPSIVRHMIPTPAQLDALRAHHDGATAALELAVRAATEWTNIDTWDALRRCVCGETARDSYNWCAPWPPQFYCTPQGVLDALGVPFVAHAPTGSDDVTLVEWTD